MEPDLDADVIVRHVKADDAQNATGLERWVIFLGREQRAESDSAQRAFMFARLLADLAQRRVWVVHDGDGTAEVLGPTAIGGCSCC